MVLEPCLRALHQGPGLENFSFFFEKCHSFTVIVLQVLIHLELTFVSCTRLRWSFPSGSMLRALGHRDSMLSVQ